jgi:hypothetical protein
VFIIAITHAHFAFARAHRIAPAPFQDEKVIFRTPTPLLAMHPDLVAPAAGRDWRFSHLSSVFPAPYQEAIVRAR